MPLNNINELPPEGWMYEQIADGKSLKKFRGMMPFGQFCMEVLRFRQSNKLPGDTIEAVRSDVDAAQCARLGNDPRWCQKKTVPFSPVRRFLAAAASVRHAATLYSSGVKTLYDWGDEGFMAVAQDEAQNRSDICSGRISGHPCPYNQAATFPLTGPVGEALKAHIEKKNGLKLAVLGEENLRACKICRCHLGLKVWTPLELVRSQMTKKVIEEFETLYPECWINKKPQTSP